MLDYVVLFVVGMFWDALISADTLFLTRGKAMAAGITTMILTILGVGIYDFLIGDPHGLNPLKLLSLALGSGFGVYLAIKFDRLNKGVRK